MLNKPFLTTSSAEKELEDNSTTNTLPEPLGFPGISSQEFEILRPLVKEAKVIWVYPIYGDSCIPTEEAFVTRLRNIGYQIEGFPIFCDGSWWQFPKLHENYSDKGHWIHKYYQVLRDRMSENDILIAAGGSMLHPDFIDSLPQHSVFLCADDPESSHIISMPAAPAFSVACPTNMACLEMYKSFGCKNIQWVYHGFPADQETLSRNIANVSHRDIEIILLCERIFNLSDRAVRIEGLYQKFPQALIRGRGWPGGHVDPDMHYLRSKIGWNLHHSTGPTNTRTILLPGFGVLELCDNREHLSKMFILDEEVIAYDSLEDCCEKTQFFLKFDEERQRIAANGHKRVMSYYTEERMLVGLCAAYARQQNSLISKNR